jgi:microsomal dipeptidase-like Zn-dependent dipeptidase
MGGQAVGYPSFKEWPKWNDITHQKMWVDWIRRSYDGGQRVLVALAVNNATLAGIASGPNDGPTDDKASADLQIAEMKKFVARHDDFMEIAYTSADLRRIVAANKLAVVLGAEIDHIGNFNKFPKPLPDAVVGVEIKRLYDEGVRYLFPVHVLDNEFGHTAAYEDLFNYSDKRESGQWWDLVCAKYQDELNYDFEPLLGDDIPKEVKDFFSGVGAIKIKLDLKAPTYPKCQYGQRNGNVGLTPQGRYAIKEMMKLGMLIDIDHMSQTTVGDTLDLAESIFNKYPLVSGHNNIRSMWPPDKAKSDQPLRRPIAGNENARTEEQLTRLAKLGGMFGLGSDTAAGDDWAERYVAASYLIGPGRVSFGSDLNGLVKGPVPRSSTDLYTSFFPMPRTGDKTWDFRKDGVAHYGMMADFLRYVAKDTKYGAYVGSHIMDNAEYFARMWEKAEANSKYVK